MYKNTGPIFLPRDLCKALSCTNALNGARPVPNPAMIIGVISSAGSFITDGFTLTVTFAPIGNLDKYRVLCPYLSRFFVSRQLTSTTNKCTDVGWTRCDEAILYSRRLIAGINRIRSDNPGLADGNSSRISANVRVSTSALRLNSAAPSDPPRASNF